MAVNGISSASSYISNLSQASARADTSAERVASGQRINRAADDAAGLAISNRNTSAIRGFEQSIRNANDGISLLETAGASLSGITEGVQRLQELALQASNGTLSNNDRSAINKEAQQLMSEIGRTVETTSFNGNKLLSGSDPIDLQVGSDSDDKLTVDLDDLGQKLEDLGFNDLDFSTASGAQDALKILGDTQSQVDGLNATIGASSNRLESTISNLGNSIVASSESQSRIQDADMAKEISTMINEQLKEDVGIAMQAKANAQRGNVLRLLGL